jgi:hypothetical protein
MSYDARPFFLSLFFPEGLEDPREPCLFNYLFSNCNLRATFVVAKVVVEGYRDLSLSPSYAIYT